MVNIIKELIKNQIKKTNTYKIVLIENENLKNETKNLKIMLIAYIMKNYLK